MQNLSKNDIGELKALRNPPKAVKLLMEAVCILMNVEPVKIKSKDGLGFVRDYWLAATGKHVLGNQRLLEILTNFDHTNLNMVITYSSFCYYFSKLCKNLKKELKTLSSSLRM